MDHFAPSPSVVYSPVGDHASNRDARDATMDTPSNTSAVSVLIAGCGGCGINLARSHVNYPKNTKVSFFDTSNTNLRPGETLFMVTSGSGSGSNRAENARDIESALTQLSDSEIGDADVIIAVFSAGGGSGSVIGPFFIREAHRRGKRVIGVCVVDTRSSVEAKNTLNTLKTLSAVCRNNEIYLPMIILSNDNNGRRDIVNQAAEIMISNTLDILTTDVYEVDRNDRLNWINPTKVVPSSHGMKMVSFDSQWVASDPSVVLGLGSTEMVDSMLILQNNETEEENFTKQPPTRLRKVGIFVKERSPLVGRVTSDISSIDKVIDTVEKRSDQDKANKHQSVDRLDSSDSHDLVI
jgi:hypothetical protein